MGTLTTSGAVKIKAGNAVSSDLTNSDYDTLISQAESFINVATRTNWTDSYSSLNEDVKKALEDAASSHAAVVAINYDMSGYTSRAEAQTMLNVNWARLQELISYLEDTKYITFLEDA